MSSSGLLRKLSGRVSCHQPRKTSQTLAARKEDRADRKTEPPLAGPCGGLGTRNAVSRTASGENSLNQHWRTKHPRGLSTRTRSLCSFVLAQEDRPKRKRQKVRVSTNLAQSRLSLFAIDSLRAMRYIQAAHTGGSAVIFENLHDGEEIATIRYMYLETSPLGSPGMFPSKVFVYWDHGGGGHPG